MSVLSMTVFMWYRKPGAQHLPGAFLCGAAADVALRSHSQRRWTGKFVCSKFRWEMSLYVTDILLRSRWRWVEDRCHFSFIFADVLEKCYLRQVHNCVYFAVKVLENQFQWVFISRVEESFVAVQVIKRLVSNQVFSGRLVSHLDKCTLRLLAENERVASFSPELRDRLTQAQDKSTAKVALWGCHAAQRACCINF